ncbi:MAG: hypothetical protein V4592_20520 [Bacteroidota bacterium]
MKNEQDFLKQMENLSIPDVDPSLHQQKVKMTIMNAERSAALGVWLIVLPGYFLLCALMSAFFHNKAIDSWLFGMLFRDLLSTRASILDSLLFFGLPIICIIINLLAIVHVQVEHISPTQRKYKELSLTIKLKFWNILLIVISTALLILFII